MKRYNPKEIEAKWQKAWAEGRIYEVAENSDKPKIYATPMLPYPSGTGLHTGHVRNYSITDAVARFHRQKGFNTMSNMAWDAFGLPAENYAIKTGTPPAESTAKNIAYFKEQLLRLGMSYAWEREFNTSDPDYYRWTQWLFSLMYERGLAYQAERLQWWCDKCKTVLADEQVVAGKCWRHDAPEDPLVTKKSLKQWFFKITDYADQILDATDDLNWPEKIKTMQKNWIGRSQGAELDFATESGEPIRVFTTRPDTLYGATFMVLAPEHPLVDVLTSPEQKEAVEAYRAEAVKKDDIERQANKEKTGVFTGGYAVNPASGERIPVWIADYVLMGYGTGAIMAVPAHDERDHEFAEKFGLKEIAVFDADSAELVHGGEGVVKNSGPYDGLRTEAAREKIVNDLSQQGLAEEKVNYKIRDWLISRQRYWGAPIPIIHCEEHGAVLVPDEQLPVKLPEVKNFAPDGSNSSVLAGVDEWVNTTCPTCGKPARRETDTMDGYVCSTWYLHRYTDAHNSEQAFSPDKTNYWFPLDFYFGGDHAVAHLLYVRFFQRVLVDAGLANEPEPIKRLVYNGYINAEDGSKMSKSKGNTVDPMDLINAGYGADSLRVFELFIAPYDQDTPWNQSGVPGAYKFLNRLWVLTQEYLESDSSDGNDEEVLKVAHKVIHKVTDDLDHLGFNTAVAAMMTAVNELYLIKAKTGYAGRDSWQFALESLAQLLAPFAPHISEELWQELGHSDTVHVDHWPVWDNKYLVSDELTIVIQVNGRLRATIQVPAGASKEQILETAKREENVAKHLAGSEIKKEIYVPGKLVNLVI